MSDRAPGNPRVRRYASSPFVDLARAKAAIEAGGRSEIAARSRFQRGECHFTLGRHDRAIEELIQVEANYAYPEWSARAILEIGRALQAQDRPGPAAERYREVMERYGKSEAAAAARQLLERMPRR